MRIGGRPMRTIAPAGDGSVEILDQTLLPHRVALVRLRTCDEARAAIVSMQVRGAPLIGIAAEHNVIFPAAGGKEEPSQTCTVITTLLDHEAAPA
ncbi:MAG: hypothetical protein ACREEH_03450, partial [Caulobacteraceae bacterium]